jgi:hypothetical protein
VEPGLQATYYWFASLQTLLQILKKIDFKTLRYHPEKGFFHARNADENRYLKLDNQVPSNIPNRTDLLDALHQFDTQFETRWFCGSFLDSIWSNDISLGHSVLIQQAMSPKHPYTNTTMDQEEWGSKKCPHLGNKKAQVLDFISSSQLMEVGIPIPPSTRFLTMILIQRISAPVSFPQLPSTNGMSQTICGLYSHHLWKSTRVWTTLVYLPMVPK